MARGLLLLAVLSLIALLGVNVYYRALVSEERRSDFIVFHAAGAELLRGGDPYDIAHERGWPFVYPPGAAVFFTPLGAMPLSVAVVAWYLLSLFSLCWGVHRLVQLCDLAGGRALGGIVIVAVIVNFGPIVSGLQRGQVSALLFGFMMEAVWRIHLGRSASAGVWIGLATTIKVFPALLLWPAVCGLNRLRAIAVLIAFTMLTSVMLNASPAIWLGSGKAIDLVGRFIERASSSARPSGTAADKLSGNPDENRHFGTVNVLGPVNQSPFAVAGRWLCRDAIPKHEPFALTLANWPLERVGRLSAIGVGGAVLLLGVAAFIAGRRRDDADQNAERDSRPMLAVWAVALALAPCISPIAWHHAFTSLTMLYATAGVLIATESRVGLRRMLIVVLAIAIAGNWLHFGWYEARQAGALLIGTAVLCVALALWTLSSPGCCVRSSPSADRASEGNRD